MTDLFSASFQVDHADYIRKSKDYRKRGEDALYMVKELVQNLHFFRLDGNIANLQQALEKVLLDSVVKLSLLEGFFL